MEEVLAAIQAAALLLNMAQQFTAAKAAGTDPMTLVPNAVATALASAGAVTTGGAANTVKELEAAFVPLTNIVTGLLSLLPQVVAAPAKTAA